MDTFANKVGKMSKGELLEEGFYQFLNLITYCNLGTVAPTLAGASASEVAAIAQVAKNLNLIFKQETALAKPFFEKHYFLEGYHQVLTPLTTVVGDGIEVLAVSLGCEKGFGKTLINFAQKDKAFLRSKFLGKSLPDKLKNFAQRFWDKRKQTGARQVAPTNDLEAWEVWAPKKYAKIENCKTDIEIIAKNTKMPVYKIKRIKHHIFHDDSHILDKGVGKFSPDPEIASAWDRLVKGDFVKNDIKLLEHEYFESKFEKLWEVSYRTAHKTAENSGRKWKPIN